MDKVSQDSTKLLTEKLALSRELNTLKPELEHLRAQNGNQQALVAEKLSLQRQLDSLEVELAAERRSKQKNSAKDSGNEADEALRRKVNELEKSLAAEKKETARVRKEAERAAAEFAGKQELLEQRLDMMKSKLRDTQDELKRRRAELAQTKDATIAIPEPTQTLSLTQPLTRRKRRANEITVDDVTVHTPDKLESKAARAAKKRAVVHAAVGEKSHFSITPFLNKTAALDEVNDSPQSPSLEKDHTGKSNEQAKAVSKPSASPKAPTPSVKKVLAPSAQPKPRGRPKKILGESTASKNVPIVKPKAAKAQKDATIILGKVLEEPEAPVPSSKQDQENQPPTKPTTAHEPLDLLSAFVPPRQSSGSATSGTDAEPKKKKRKLLGAATKTIFDDEEGEPPAAAAAAKRPAKVQLGAVRSRPLAKGPLGAVRASAFAKTTFSPLKKDRRGVGASFLA